MDGYLPGRDQSRPGEIFFNCHGMQSDFLPQSRARIPLTDKSFSMGRRLESDHTLELTETNLDKPAQSQFAGCMCIEGRPVPEERLRSPGDSWA